MSAVVRKRYPFCESLFEPRLWPPVNTISLNGSDAFNLTPEFKIRLLCAIIGLIIEKYTFYTSCYYNFDDSFNLSELKIRNTI